MFLKLRFYFRLLVAFLVQYKIILLLGIIIGIAFFFGFSFFQKSSFASTKLEGVVGRYRSDKLPSEIVSLIGDGLTAVNEQGEVEPNLAVSWETPDKGKTWIFTLDTEKTWQDGNKVTSDTILYEFSDVSIERPDESTIIFQLSEPFSPFPSVVSKPTFRKGLLGTGDWKVEKILISNGFVQKLILENTEGQKKTIKFYPTEDEAKLAFKLGEVDLLNNIINPMPFGEWSQSQLTSSSDLGSVVTMFINTQDPVLSDKSFRQGLIYAINKNDLGGKRAIGPIKPSSWAYNPQVKEYLYDQERAVELIDELPQELSEDLIIKLVTTPPLLSTAEKIADYWKLAGVNTQVQVSSVVPQDYQVFLTIFETPNDPDQYPFWHSTQLISNISNYSNPRIDKLLEDGRVELTKEERKKIYLDFQRFLVEDSPAAFLFHPEVYKIERN